MSSVLVRNTRFDLTRRGSKYWGADGDAWAKAVSDELARLDGGFESAKDVLFGIDGTTGTDNVLAIANAVKLQAEINKAAVRGTDVLLQPGIYVYASPLLVPAGVKVRGLGRGANPLTTPSVGTVLKYIGTESAVKIQGHMAGVSNLTILGTSSALGAGLHLDADGHALESCSFENVLVYGFLSGTGIYLNAINAGSIAYATFVNARVRNAKTGIWIVDTGGGSGFCNTNQFFGGAISGGGFDYVVRVQGGNNNKFLGMSVEPPTSTYGHFVVEGGAIEFDGRIEAGSQPAGTPVIDIWSDADEGYILGLFGGGLVKNVSKKFYVPQSGKNAFPRVPSRNLFPNPNFADVDTSAKTIRDWTATATGTAATWTRGAAEVTDDHAVLQVDIPAGATLELKPTAKPTKYEWTQCTFGIHVKSAGAANIYARLNGVGGVTVSASYPNTGAWQVVGMAQNFDSSASPDPRFVIDNSANPASATVYLSAPFFGFGLVQVDVVRSFSAAGGVINGTIQGGGCTITLPAAGSDDFYSTTGPELTVPSWGNIIHIAGTARTIARLNNLSANRFPKYTQLRLVFDIAGVGVSNSGFITLSAAFSSTVGAWLLLESDGDGTWTELDRRVP